MAIQDVPGAGESGGGHPTSWTVNMGTAPLHCHDSEWKQHLKESNERGQQRKDYTCWKCACTSLSGNWTCIFIMTIMTRGTSALTMTCMGSCPWPCSPMHWPASP
jgi:hypothetical protein